MPSALPEPDAPLPPGCTSETAAVNGVRLHFVHGGRGPLVVLLHGFPEFWYSWHRQFPALADGGFHAVAPDMRGYNLSDKPRGIEAYRIEKLVGDVAMLIRHFGEERAVVVGHDWGGVVAWSVAMYRPDMVSKLVILNAPHLGPFLREIRTPGQMLRSAYVLCFQLPLLPEALIRAGNFSLVARTLRRDPVRPDAFTPEDVHYYRLALSRPGALTGGLNYYRAWVRHARRYANAIRTIEAPTLVIWGMRDRYLGPRLLNGLERWVPNVRVERIADASHWVQNDAPERVNDLLRGFLGPVP